MKIKNNLCIGHTLWLVMIVATIIMCSCINDKILVNETALGLESEKKVFGVIILSREYHHVVQYKVKTEFDTINIISYKDKNGGFKEMKDGAFSIRKISHFRLLYPSMPQVLSLVFPNDTIHFLHTDSVYIHISNNLKFFKDYKLEKIRHEQDGIRFTIPSILMFR